MGNVMVGSRDGGRRSAAWRVPQDFAKRLNMSQNRMSAGSSDPDIVCVAGLALLTDEECCGITGGEGEPVVEMEEMVIEVPLPPDVDS